MKPFHNTHPNEIIVARGAGGIVAETSACSSAGANEAVTFDGNVGDDESYFSVGWRWHCQGPVGIVHPRVSIRVVLRFDVAYKIFARQ